MLSVGGQNAHTTNPRWRTATILKKNEKSLYLGNGLIYCHRIWHDDSKWLSEHDSVSKIWTFKKPRWWMATIL